MDDAMKGKATVERRAHRRRATGECGWISKARVRPGVDVRLLDLSSGGALVEGAVRLLPGSRVELQLSSSDTRRVIAGRVLRCNVSALSAEHGIRYTAAVGFETRLAMPGEEAAGDGYLVPRGFSRLAGSKGRSYPAADFDRPS